MVAIVAGAGLGLERSSAFVLGSRGQLGHAGLGRAQENVYVNAATGNLVVSNVDEMLIGLGPDNAIARTYNSLGALNDDNGDNWRAGVSRKVAGLTGTINTAGSTVTRTDWDGAETVYTWDAGRSAYVSMEGAGAYDTLTYASNVWTWTDGDSRVTERYDNNNGGRILTSADADGNKLTFAYNGSGLVSRVTTQDGNYTDLVYAGTLLTQVETKYQTTQGGSFSTLTRVRYGYDTSDRLVTVTIDKSPTDNAVSDGNTYVTTYTYDGASRRVASITQTDGSSLTVGYTLVGSDYRVTSLVQTAAAGVTRTTSLSYNIATRVTTITDPAGQVTKMTYDAAGQLTKMELPPAHSGAAAQVLQYAYNTNGDVQTVTDASGAVVTYAYDGNGNLTSSRDALGNTVVYTYGANNQLLTETKYSAPMPGTGGNLAPVAGGDTIVVTAVGDSITFDPRTNDSDFEGDPLTITAVSTPTKGTAVIAGGGTKITYTRTSAGADSFTYTISDGQGNTVTATVTVAESSALTTQAPTAANDSLVVGVGASRTFDPRANDSDPENGKLTITAVTGATKGTATIVGSGTGIQYARTSVGIDTITYTITDAQGLTTTGTITVSDSVGGANVAPVAMADTIVVTEVGQALTFDPRLNDVDFDRDSLTITAVSTPTKGTATISGGKIVYTRTGAGGDSFTYTISDGQGNTATATVTVRDTIAASNQAPVGNNDSYTLTGIGKTLIFDPRVNDTDADADQLTITAVSGATKGVATIVSGGKGLAYTRTANGTDTITYTLSDGHGNTTTATVEIDDSLGANGDPFTQVDFVDVVGGVPKIFDPRVNDYDPDGDPLIITSVNGAFYGTATIVGGGTAIEYTGPGYYEYLWYTVSDGRGGESYGDIVVMSGFGDQPPVANADDVIVGSSLTFDPRANDGDVDLDAITITAVSTPTKGTATIVGGGTAILYTRTSAGTDSFTYTITAGGQTATATITIGMPPANQAPTPMADSIVVRGIGDALTFDPLVNDRDVDVDTLTITAVSTPGKGTATLSAGKITYTRTSAGSDSFTYTVSDGNGHSQTVTVTVADVLPGTNGAPTAAVDQVTVGVGSSVSFDPRANDSDPDTDGLTITAASGSTKGTVSIIGGGTGITYTRSSAGTDSFTYTISDGRGGTNTATVTVLDPPASNQAPNAVADTIVVNAVGDAITFDPRVNDADFDRDTLTVTAVSTPGKGTATIVGGKIVYTRTSAGADSFTYTISDGNGHTDTVTVTVATISSGGAAVSTPFTTRYVYDAENHLTYVVSAEGHVTRYVYDTQGRQTAAIDYAANAYNISGLAPGASLSDSTMNTWASGISNKSTTTRTDTTYDFRGNVATVTSWEKTLSSGAADTSGASSQITYVYDQAGRLLSRQVGGSGPSETFLYDGMGRLIASDFNTVTTTIAFDDPATTTTITLSNGLQQVSTYNKAGELISYAEAASGMATVTTQYSYDAMGRLRYVSDPTGVGSHYLYDHVGRKVAEIGVDRSLVEYRYDANDRLVATIAYKNLLSAGQLNSLLSGGQPTAVQLSSVRPSSNAADRWEWRIYDAAGRLTQTIDAGGAVRSYAYDGASRLVSTTAYATVVAVAGYKTTLPTAPVSVTANAADDRTIRNFYDADGRLIGTLDGEGYLTQVVYDEAGRKTKTIGYATVTAQVDRAGGSFATLLAGVTATTNPKDIHNWFVYDGRDFLRATVNGEGDIVRYRYTALGYLDQEVRGQKLNPTTLIATPPTLASVASAPASGSLETTTWTRNLYGQALTEVRTLASGNETITYTYDAQRRLVSSAVSGTTADPRTQTQRYDVRGRLVGSLSGEGSAALAALGGSPTQSQIDNVYATWGVTYVYDAADRLVARIDPDGTGSSGRKTRYYYNTDGALTHTINALGEVVEQRYDVFGQRSDTIAYAARIASGTLATLNGGVVDTALTNAVTAITNAAADSKVTLGYNVTGTVSQSVDSLGYATTYAYNAFGEEVSRTKPFTSSISVTTASVYDRRGLLLSSTVDATGLNLISSAVYDAFGRAVQVTDPNGAVRSTAYDRAGRTIASTDALGQTTSYTYDGRGNTLTVTNRNGKTTSFTYNAFSRQVVMTTAEGISTTTNTSAHGQTLSIVDGAGRTTTYGYDKDGALKTVSDAAGTTTNAYDKAGRIVLVTNALGTKTAFTYDAASRVLTQVVDEGAGRLNLTTTYGYDAKGQRVQVTDAGGTVTEITFDRKGQKTAVVIDPGGLALRTEYTYDRSGRMLTATEGVGTAAVRATSYVYDRADRLTQTRVDPTGLNLSTSYTYDKNGNVAAKTDAASAKTRYVYDAENRLTWTVDAEGAVTRLTYDGEGRVTKTYAYATKVLAATLSSWPLAVTEAQVLAAVSTTAPDRASRVVYDGDGRATFEVDAEGYVTRYVYNGAGQVTEKVRYAAAYTVSDGATVPSLTTLIGSPAGAATTTFAYDNAGRLTDVTDPEGVVTRLVMDAIGQVTETKVAYNTTDEAVTRRVYDRAGRVTSETRGYGTAEASTTSYTYDALGRVLTTTDGRGFVTTRTYDAAGRLLTVSVPLDVGVNAVTTNQYDAVGNLVKVTDPRSNVGHFYYDKAGRLTLQVDPEGYATQTTYSVHGEPLTIKRYYTATTGAAVGAPPTLVTNAKDATTTIARDKLGRVTRVTDAEGAYENYTLDAFGDRISVRNKLGGITTNTFDKRGLLLTETLPINSVLAGGTVQATSVINKYAYDARGNRIQSIEAFGLAEQRTTAYAYDKLDRLVSKSGDAVQVTADNLSTVTTVTPTETYAYDKRGNLIQTTDAADAITFAWYDDLNRKVAEVDAMNSLKVWTYDANGNATKARIYGDFLTTTPTAGGTAPVPVNASNYRETLFEYDRNNRLVLTKVVGLTTGEYGSAYATSTGDITTQAKYDVAGNVIERIDERGNSTFLFYDRLGRQSAQVDQDNYLTVYERDAEGNVLKEERFATKLTGTVTIASNPVTLRAGVAGNAADRTTTFAYDRNGRRLTETRLAVNAHEVTSIGVLQAGAANATITYTYNGLGQVTRKTEANGDYIDYAYDVGGRQSTATKSAFTDHLGTNVQHRTVYEYDGLNNLSRMTERKASGTSADDRLTTFTYGAGGRMASMTDATGFTRSYAYDVTGRVVKESYTRARSDGTTVTEARAWRYDALGRAKLESTAVLSGSTWTFGDTTHYRYDSFGQLTGRGVTGDATVAAVYQETFDYDAGGRLWRTNADTGSTRILLHDATGRITLEIASVGTDLATHTAATALALLTNNGANAVGAVAVDGVVATITTYDKRGQATSTREPQRQLAKTGASTYATADIVKGRTYNAFGEVSSETDARSHTTDFAYNTMGRLVLKTSPEVSVTGEDGGAYLTRPEEAYYYDVSGRLIATEDANGNVERRTLLAGSGHGGEEAKVTAKFHADTSIEQIGYDFLGNARKFTNGLGAVETRAYDKGGRLLTIVRPQRSGGVQLTENYTYDGLGRRLTHWNSQLGSLVKEATDYDYKGRVTRMQDFGGNVTTYSYTWDPAIATGGLGAFGGWTKLTTIPANKTSTEKTDYFGRMAARTDYGGHVYTLTFDKAGRLVSQTSTADQNITYSYFNTGLMAGNVDATGYAGYYGYNVTAQYVYDVGGNRLKENYASTFWNYDWFTEQLIEGATTVHQNAVVTYDALNRMLSFVDDASGTSGTINVAWEYDAQGNIRRMTASSPALYESQDYWYAYDSMNRFVTTQGTLSGTAGASGTTIVRGELGTEHLYDAAGQRVMAIFNLVQVPWGIDVKDEYIYSADGYVMQVNSATFFSTDPPPTTLSTKLLYTRDALGRVLTVANPMGNNNNYSYTYNNKGEVTYSYSRTYNTGNEYIVTQQYYDYNMQTSPGVYNGQNLGGLATHVRTTKRYEQSNGTLKYNAPTSDTWYTYEWWDGGLKDIETLDPDAGSSSNPLSTSNMSYDTSGHLSSVYVNDASPFTINYVTDVQGQVLSRTQTNNAIKDVYLYFNGQKVADLRYSGAAIMTADFDQAYSGIYDSPTTKAETGGRYVVREGDTFQSIASQLWGDAALWWALAEANGMTSDSELAAGQTLTIPSNVEPIHNNADTFRPYDPNRAIGNTSPVRPKMPPPPKAEAGCGVAQIFVAIIAIVVVALVAPHAIAGVANLIGGAGTASVSAGALGFSGVTFAGVGGATVAAGATAASVGTIAVSSFVGGAIAGAVGSIVSQGAAMAMGIQDKFSWNAVALGAIGSGVTAGLANVGPLAGGSWGMAAMRGMAGNAITQGIGVATGMQDRFDWTSVAVAGVVSGVGSAVGGAIGGMFGSNPSQLESLVIDGISNLAGGVAGAASRSLIEGSDFGDNMMAVLPDVIAATVGNAIARGVSGLSERRQRNQTIDALAKLPAYENRSREDLADMADILKRFDANNGERGMALQRVLKSEEAQQTLGKYLDVERYETFIPSPPDEVGEDGGIIVTAPKPGTIKYALYTSQNAFQQIGGLSFDDAYAAVDVLDQNIRNSRASTGVEPALLSNEVDAFMMGAGDTATWVAEKIGERPLLRWSLEAVSVASGPAQYAIGKVLEPITEPAIGRLTEAAQDRFSSTGHTDADSGRGATGVLAVGSLVVGAALGGSVIRGLEIFTGFRLQINGLGGNGGNIGFRRLGAAERAADRGFPGVGTTPNGGPTFAGTPYLYAAGLGQSSVVQISLTGSRRSDNAAAFRAAGIEVTPEISDNFRWHHVDDFDPRTGTATMELVQRRAHEAASGHSGAVSQWEAFTRTRYRR